MSQLQNIIISLAIMATLRHNGRGALKQKKRTASVEKPSTPKGSGVRDKNRKPSASNGRLIRRLKSIYISQARVPSYILRQQAGRW